MLPGGTAMTNLAANTRAQPALFRAGDIGVSSEWRDISYDWPPILTAAGVSIYSYLRDTYDHQRSLRPFILNPDGPTKTLIQQMLGYRTSWAIQGPEYLLSTVGLLHVEVGYGPSLDPERPKRTRVAYYVVGRLDHPVLDWSMLDRVLDALMPALDTTPSEPGGAEGQRKALAALRSLAQAGMLQDTDPEALLYPYGAWPTLLPTLVDDARWIALFTHLHGTDAVVRYRRQARAWVEYVQRAAARLMEENRAIGDHLLAAQRRGPHGGGSPPDSLPQLSRSPGEGPGATPQHGATQAVGVTRTASSDNASLVSRQAVGVTRTASATPLQQPHTNAPNHADTSSIGVSLERDQSINRGRRSEQNSQPSVPATDGATPDGTTTELHTSAVPLVEPHLEDAELTSTRQDAYFWCAVQEILYGTHQRYNHTPGEKQAALRQFKRTNTPIGVILAALRAVMTLPASQRPQTFGDALKLEVFHACVQQALALLPTRRTAADVASSWPQFLAAYRTIGQPNGLRDVTTSDYHVLTALFAKQPDECWEVLNRVEHAAQRPDLSPAYLRRAIVNNQRAATQQALMLPASAAACRSAGDSAAVLPPPQADESPVLADDVRRALLEHEGVSPTLLTDAMTEAYIRLWIAEADARREQVYNRPRWLAWGLQSGVAPAQHPQLRPRQHRSPEQVRSAPSTPLPTPSAADATPGSASPLQTVWHNVLGMLHDRLPRDEFETWISSCQLLALDLDAAPDAARPRAIVGAPNIFVRLKLEDTYHSALAATLHACLQQEVEVHCVVGTSE